MELVQVPGFMLENILLLFGCFNLPQLTIISLQQVKQNSVSDYILNYFLGGYGTGGVSSYHNLVCKFNKETLEWDEVGAIREYRNWQGVSVVNKQDVEMYCLSSDVMEDPVHKKYNEKFVDPNEEKFLNYKKNN